MNIRALFLHHDVSPVTLRNWQQLLQNHPQTSEAIWFNSSSATGQGIDGSTKVAGVPHIVIPHLIRQFHDRIFYNWMLENTGNSAKRADWYALVHWDTYVASSLDDFYGGLDTELDVGVTQIHQRGDNWKLWSQAQWFDSLKIPDKLLGIETTCMTLIKRSAFEALANHMVQYPGDAQIRFATACNVLGLKIGEIPGAKTTVTNGVTAVEGAGIFHPVKG